MDKNETINDLEMYFKQIIALCDFMLELDRYTMTNTLTIRDLAEIALKKAQIKPDIIELTASL